MNRLSAIVVAIFVTTALLSCNENLDTHSGGAGSRLEVSFEAIPEGNTPQQVIDALGEPTRKYSEEVSSDLFDLSDPKLGLKAGDEITAWAYVEGVKIFTLWFAPGAGTEEVVYEKSNVAVGGGN